MTTPEELAAEMYPEPSADEVTFFTTVEITARQRAAFLHGLVKGYARAVANVVDEIERHHEEGAPTSAFDEGDGVDAGWNAMCVSILMWLRALSPTSLAPGAGERAKDEADQIIAAINRMARRIGGTFTPDPEKLAAFRRSLALAANKEESR